MAAADGKLAAESQDGEAGEAEEKTTQVSDQLARALPCASRAVITNVEVTPAVIMLNATPEVDDKCADVAPPMTDTSNGDPKICSAARKRRADGTTERATEKAPYSSLAEALPSKYR
jgi:hypothetical protein